MSKFYFTGLLAVVKTFYLATIKKNTHALLISEKIKKDTVINFKNGSSITLLPKTGDSVRGKRAMMYPLYNNDGTVDYHFDKEKFDEIFMPFCSKKENDDINGEIINTNNNKKEKVISKINADECIDFVKNKLKIKLFDYQEEMLRAFCEGKEVRTARGIGRSYTAKAYSQYIEFLYSNNDYTKEPDICFDYTYLISNGFVSKEHLERRRLSNPELFKKEYECK